MKDRNIDWIRDRVQAIRCGDRPETESEWQAFARGLEMIDQAYSQAARVALEAVVAVDVLTGEGREQ